MAGGDSAPACAAAPTADVYYRTHGLRCVVPYWYDFATHVKGRWVGRTILDVFMNEFPHYSEGYYRKAIDEGRIRLDGGLVVPSRVLKHNEKMSHSMHRHEYPVLDTPVAIIGETDRFYAVNKPPSIPVHPCGRYAQNTLVSTLRIDHGMPGVLHPVHRLDKVTSGVLLFAKSARDAEAVGQLLRKEESKNAPEAERKVIKEYLARVVGSFPEGKTVCEYQVCCTDAKKGTMRSIIPGEGGQLTGGGDSALMALSRERQALLDDVENYRHRRTMAMEVPETGAAAAVSGAPASPKIGADGAATGETVEDAPDAGAKRDATAAAADEDPAKRVRVEGEDGAVVKQAAAAAPEGGWKHTTKREKNKPKQKGYNIAEEKKKKKELYRKLSNAQVGDAKMIPKPATTEFYKVREVTAADGSTHTVVRCLPLTGRTHQIRVHLQALGYPIVDDVLYNPSPVSIAPSKPEAPAPTTPEAIAASIPDFPTDALCQECATGGERTLVTAALDSLRDPALNNMTICLHARKYTFIEGGTTYTYEAAAPAWAGE